MRSQSRSATYASGFRGFRDFVQGRARRALRYLRAADPFASGADRRRHRRPATAGCRRRRGGGGGGGGGGGRRRRRVQPRRLFDEGAEQFGLQFGRDGEALLQRVLRQHNVVVDAGRVEQHRREQLDRLQGPKRWPKSATQWRRSKRDGSNENGHPL